MPGYSLTQEFYEDGDDIDAVVMHFMVAPLRSSPEWDGQWHSQEMAVIEPRFSTTSQADANCRHWGIIPSAHIRHREARLALPALMFDPATGQETDRYLLHYFFEIVRDSGTHNSPYYTQYVLTRARMDNGQRDASPGTMSADAMRSNPTQRGTRGKGDLFSRNGTMPGVEDEDATVFD